MDLVITGVDGYSSVGASAEMTYFSVRSGLSRLVETGATSRHGTQRIAGTLPGFHHRIDIDRLARLAAESAGRALDHAGVVSGARVGITLCLPAPFGPSDGPSVGSSLAPWRSALEAVGAARGMVFDVRALREGSASLSRAIAQAALRLERTEEDATLVGGADSLLPITMLRWLEDRRRLKIGRRVDGLIAGEAAGFVLLEPPKRRIGSGRPLAVVRAACLTQEPGHHESDAPCLSAGYVEAVCAALRLARPARQVGTLVTDLNGENYKAKEWAVAEVRSLETTPASHIHPADCFGDVGSVSGVVQLVIAALGLSRGELPGPVLVVCSAPGPQRAVVLADAVDTEAVRLEPNIEAARSELPARPLAGEMSAAIVQDHLEEAGFLRLQRRLGEARSADRWLDRFAHDRRHAWHLLALAASASSSESTLLAAARSVDRAPEDRAAAVAALALARRPAALFGLWELVEGDDAVPLAAVEAFDDLPASVRQRLLGELATHRDARARALAPRLSPDSAAGAATLLERIEFAATIADREAACTGLIERGGAGLATLLDSPGLLAMLPRETVAWATARAASPSAVSLTRELPPDEMTPRLLTALGGAGHIDAVPILLGRVGDPAVELADAAGAAIATLTGVELLQPNEADEAASKVWSRDRGQWRDAVARLPLPMNGSVRLLGGARWTALRAQAALSDPNARNGVRRVLAAGLPGDPAGRHATSFYWLQQPAPF